MTQKEYYKGFYRGLEVALELADLAIGRILDPKVQQFLLELELATNEDFDPDRDEAQGAPPEDAMV